MSSSAAGIGGALSAVWATRSGSAAITPNVFSENIEPYNRVEGVRRLNHIKLSAGSVDSFHYAKPRQQAHQLNH